MIGNVFCSGSNLGPATLDSAISNASLVSPEKIFEFFGCLCFQNYALKLPSTMSIPHYLDVCGVFASNPALSINDSVKIMEKAVESIENICWDTNAKII